jgi:hypothetical protein
MNMHSKEPPHSCGFDFLRTTAWHSLRHSRFKAVLVVYCERFSHTRLIYEAENQSIDQ